MGLWERNAPFICADRSWCGTGITSFEKGRRYFISHYSYNYVSAFCFFCLLFPMAKDAEAETRDGNIQNETEINLWYGKSSNL